MARKSRKNLMKNNLPSNDINENTNFKIYNTAIYTRLSVENSGSETTETIEMQVEFLKKFIENSVELTLYDIYIDNGFTGTDFFRRDFNRLLNDIKNNKVNCLIIKDFSRLGRNFTETCIFMEKVFPKLGVRLISVNDGYDSLKNNENDIISAFKNLINDYYAKDISKKILSSLKIKKKEGCFLGGVPPYGYVRSEDNKYKLKCDPKAAKTVRKIFDLKVKGYRSDCIAEYLNKKNILTPSMYKKKKQILTDSKFSNGKWNKYTIDFIISNMAYTGCIAYKNNQSIFKNDYNIIPDKHEAIINLDILKKAQKNLLLEKYSVKNLLFCGKCEKKIEVYNENKEVYCKIHFNVKTFYIKNLIIELKRIYLSLYISGIENLVLIIYEGFFNKGKYIAYSENNFDCLNFEPNIKEHQKIKKVLIRQKKIVSYLKENNNDFIKIIDLILKEVNKEVFIKNIYIFSDEAIQINFNFKDFFEVKI